jgi:hypothetical protein
MGRAKPAPKTEKLKNRLKPEEDEEEDDVEDNEGGEVEPTTLDGQKFLPDGNGGTLAPIKILELESAAENFRGLKERIGDLKEKLDIELYPKLRDAFLKYRPQLGAAGVYTYFDAKDEKREVAMDTEPKVSVRKVKVKKAKKGREQDANGIISGEAAADVDLEVGNENVA